MSFFIKNYKTILRFSLIAGAVSGILSCSVPVPHFPSRAFGGLTVPIWGILQYEYHLEEFDSMVTLEGPSSHIIIAFIAELNNCFIIIVFDLRLI